MRVIDSAKVEAALDYPVLVEHLRQAFRSDDITVPLRHHHEIPTYDGRDGAMLLMPAWQQGRHIGVKVVTIFPDNAKRSLPSVMGTYMLLDANSGSPLALIDGIALTLRRTACASALAARYLAREDASRLLMVGTGALASHLILAHAAVRPIRQVLIWGRNPDKARKLAKAIRKPGLSVDWTADLPAAVAGADVVSCATSSKTPVVLGEWLTPGAHLDLVGGFTPEMRETDDEAIRRARVFVDTREGACAEAGDIVIPLQTGVLRPDDITADLFELSRGDRAGRRFYDQITLFKSVGTGLEDLAAAQLTFRLT